jgi:hypothetical protein
MRGLLTQERFGFAPGDITVLLDAQATHDGILQAIDDLAAKAGRDDVAYIHYSGHGSTAPDENGDEALEGGEDSTLVAYGSRGGAAGGGARGAPGGLNGYDILDDELNVSLARLAGKTQNLVFVADACHSGTVTRGADSVATRGVPADKRPHPSAGIAPIDANAAASWVAVGAAQVREKAFEYRGDDNETYGAFTWFWARALQSSAGEDTWKTVCDRAAALLRGAQIPQTPSLEGSARMKLFGGMVGEIPKRFTVTRTYPEIQVNVGTFAGVSENSEFQVESEGVLTDAKLIVQKAEAFTCEAVAEGGPVKVGDIAVLTKWQPAFPSLKVAFQADFPSDEPMLSKLRELFGDGKLAAYELADSPRESQMLLLVTRPKRDGNGEIVMAENSALPEISEAAEPEVWAMDPSQACFYNGQESLKTAFDGKGLEVLARNLARLARLHGLYNMRLPEGGGEGLVLEYKLFAPVSEEEWASLPENARIDLKRAPPGAQRKWKLSRTVPADDATFERRPEESLLAVRADNKSDRPYYVYAVNATASAEILPFLPETPAPLSTKVAPGQARDFDSVLLLTEEDEYVRVIATLSPIDVHILQQSSVEAYHRGANSTRGQANPVEALFREQLYRTRGKAASSALPPAELASKGTSFVTATQ